MADPTQAADLAAHALGVPTMAPALVRICHRESVGPVWTRPGQCTALGVHSLDSGHSLSVHTRAVEAGLLREGCQPYAGGGWATRGPWGLMAAYHVHLLGPCAPKWLLDLPLPAAIAAGRKLKAHCKLPPPGARTSTGKRRKAKHPATIRWAAGQEGEDGCAWWRALREGRTL